MRQIPIPIPDRPGLREPTRQALASIAAAFTRLALRAEPFRSMLMIPGARLSAVIEADEDRLHRARQVALAAYHLHERLAPDEVLWAADAYMSQRSPDDDDPPLPADDPTAQEVLVFQHVVVDGGQVALYHADMPYGRGDDGVIIWRTPHRWQLRPSGQPLSALEAAVTFAVVGLPAEVAELGPAPDEEQLAELGVFIGNTAHGDNGGP